MYGNGYFGDYFGDGYFGPGGGGDSTYLTQFIRRKLSERKRKTEGRAALPCFVLRIRLELAKAEVVHVEPPAPIRIPVDVRLEPLAMPKSFLGRIAVDCGASLALKRIDASGMLAKVRRIQSLRELEDHLLTSGFDSGSVKLAKRLDLLDVYGEYLETWNAPRTLHH